MVLMIVVVVWDFGMAFRSAGMMARSDHGFVEGELAGGKKLAALETDSEFNIKGKWQDVGGMGDLRREFIAV
jgi:hypothetical protein